MHTFETAGSAPSNTESSRVAPIVESLSGSDLGWSSLVVVSGVRTLVDAISSAPIAGFFSTSSFTLTSFSTMASDSDASEAEEVKDSFVPLRDFINASPASTILVEGSRWGVSKAPDRSYFRGHICRTDPNVEVRLLSLAWGGRGLGSLSKSCCQATILSCL